MDNDLLMSLVPLSHSLSPPMDSQAPDVPCPADGFFSPYWDNPSCGLVLNSVLSSMASSPASLANHGFLVKELIGKLRVGSFPPNESAQELGHYAFVPNPGFPNYSSMAMRFHGSRGFDGHPSQFAEMMSRVSSSHSVSPIGSQARDPQGSKKPIPVLQDQAALWNTNADSSVSDPEKNPGQEMGAKAPSPGQANCKKRKAAAVPAKKETEVGIDAKRPKQSNAGHGNEAGSVKTEEEAGRGNDGKNAKGKDDTTQVKSDAKLPEPPKDYIHVRARRGQATDSHSLAERVRREKISERMKTLQDLVPGCNKVTGKALMLDEIINYVQSLQRQAEFLSMKLASVNTGSDTNAANEMVKDVFHSYTDRRVHQMPYQMLPSNPSPHGQKSPSVHLPNRTTRQYSTDPLDASFLPYPSSFRGEDLHSIVQMGYGQN